MPRAFNYARVPPIYFGTGKLRLLPELVRKQGGRAVLLVTGNKSFEASGQLQGTLELLGGVGIEPHRVVCGAEPSAAMIDRACTEKRDANIDVVVAIGGGSVVDAGKAISAMLPHDNSIVDHLEGVGRGIPHSGVKKPLIAVPTTSGTGSEVTKNAVISQVGPNGFKKSIRHDNFIPDAVIIDGALMTSCSPRITAACGMDALTQLLEPYLSPTASAMTEALAWSGLEAIKGNLLAACGARGSDVAVRENLAYAALMSGIALANDGLGVLHGLAGPIGGFFDIPHGVVCATLVAASTRANLKALRARAAAGPAIDKLARVGALLDGQPGRTRESYCDALVHILDDWTSTLQVPRLGEYGIGEGDLEQILDRAGNRNNPIELDRAGMRAILAERL